MFTQATSFDRDSVFNACHKEILWKKETEFYEQTTDPFIQRTRKEKTKSKRGQEVKASYYHSVSHHIVFTNPHSVDSYDGSLSFFMPAERAMSPHLQQLTQDCIREQIMTTFLQFFFISDHGLTHRIKLMLTCTMCTVCAAHTCLSCWVSRNREAIVRAAAEPDQLTPQWVSAGATCLHIPLSLHH